MNKLIKSAVAFLLIACIIAGFYAACDTAYNALKSNYLTETPAATISFFAQNTVANFIFVLVFGALAFAIIAILILVFRKASFRIDRVIALVSSIAAVVLPSVIIGIIVNEFYLPYFFAPVSMLINGLILFATLVLSIIIAYINTRFVSVFRKKPIIIGSVVLSVAIVGITAIGFINDSGNNRISEDNPAVGPNIIIITIDALRRDRISAYGEHPGISPNIDSFGENAVRFDSACSPAPWTIPSLYSMLCSRYPGVHGAEMFEMGHPDIAIMPEVLRSKGFETEGYVANASLYGEFGFNRGFDKYSEYGDLPFAETLSKASIFRAIKKINNHVLPHLGIKQEDSTSWLTKKVIKTLKKDRDKPLFLWAHYLDPHTPLTPPREYIKLNDEDAEAALEYAELKSTKFLSLDESHKNELIALYEAEVSYVDVCVGDIIQVLEDGGYFEDSIIIISADHGEAFFEHGHYGHGRTHYKEEIDIPLFVYIPGIEPGDTDYPVSLIDIMPTVFNYMAIDNPPYMSGESLLPLMNGLTPEGDRLLFIDRTESDDNVRSVRDVHYSLMRRGESDFSYTMIDNYIDLGPDDIIENPPPELYDRYKNSLDEYIENTAKEREKLSEADTNIEIDDDRRDTIKGLGYL